MAIATMPAMTVDAVREHTPMKVNAMTTMAVRPKLAWALVGAREFSSRCPVLVMQRRWTSQQLQALTAAVSQM
jgi:hypothetical protein